MSWRVIRHQPPLHFQEILQAFALYNDCSVQAIFYLTRIQIGKRTNDPVESPIDRLAFIEQTQCKGLNLFPILLFKIFGLGGNHFDNCVCVGNKPPAALKNGFSFYLLFSTAYIINATVRKMTV